MKTCVINFRTYILLLILFVYRKLYLFVFLIRNQYHHFYFGIWVYLRLIEELAFNLMMVFHKNILFCTFVVWCTLKFLGKGAYREIIINVYNKCFNSYFSQKLQIYINLFMYSILYILIYLASEETPFQHCQYKSQQIKQRKRIYLILVSQRQCRNLTMRTQGTWGGLCRKSAFFLFFLCGTRTD